MNSIRPLATITILTVVGAFLYMKINEDPQLTSQAGDHWGNPSVAPAPGVPGLSTEPAGTPPLAGTTPTPAAEASMSGSRYAAAAPAWTPPPADQTAETTSPGQVAGGSPALRAPAQAAYPASADNSLSQLAGDPAARPVPLSPTEPTSVPPLPTIPALPPLPAASPTDSQQLSGMPLPNNIPQARYGAPAAKSGQSAPPAVSGRVPDLGTATADINGPALNGMATNAPGSASPNAYATTAPGPPQSAEATNSATLPPYPATPSTTSPVGDAAATSVSASGYVTARPAIQATLDRGELARAHLLLSQWYGDPSLSPAEANEVNQVLGQLAGTVIYSNQHRLEPPYTVQVGETLETIAQKYGVPWPLLAKINGIPRADQLESGQQLKVVRGPFTGVIRLSQRELTLVVDGRYAGRFPVEVPQGVVVDEGHWEVEQKLLTPNAHGITQASTQVAPTAPSVNRQLVLKSVSPAATAGTLTLGTRNSSVSPQTASTDIRLSPADTEELCDILSVGSRVVIVR